MGRYGRRNKRPGKTRKIITIDKLFSVVLCAFLVIGLCEALSSKKKKEQQDEHQ